MLDDKKTEDVLSSVVFLISCMERLENRLRLIERRVRDVESDHERISKRIDVDALVRLSRQVASGGGELERLPSRIGGLLPTAEPVKDIAVVVAVHNAPEVTERCLASLFENCGYSRLVVVDDASDAPTSELLDRMVVRRDFTLIRNASNLGYTKSINIGVRNIGGADAVVVLNSDTVVTFGWLDRIRRAFNANPKAGIVGPWSNAATYQSVPAVKESSGQFAVNKIPGSVVPDDWALALCQEPTYPRTPIVNGFCFAVRKDVFDRIGEFDETGFPTGYGEENDFCIRAVDAGFEIVVADDTFVYHEKSKSFGAARRKKLSAAGRAVLNGKHGASRMKDIVRELESSIDLNKSREDAASRVSRAASSSLFAAFRGSIAYVLPAKPGGGGVHSIIQEASFLAANGIEATVLVPWSELAAFTAFYGEQVRSLVVGYRSMQDLNIRLRSHSVIVATVYKSIALIQHLIGTMNARFFYYIQDYEPFFHEEGTREYQAALASYDVDSSCTLFAKTKWLQETVRERHGKEVHVVPPSVDHDTFFPPNEIHRRDRVCAMVRPPTPRRSPVETVRLAKKLASRRTRPLSVSLFGCDPDDPVLAPVRRLSRVDCVGKLRREEVAELLRASDIFVDLSTYQAFGRASIEAMACGCVPIVPTRGGSAEFAVPGWNSHAVDVSNSGYLRSCTEKIDAIYADFEHLRPRSLATAAKYSTKSAAVAILKLFMQGQR